MVLKLYFHTRLARVESERPAVAQLITHPRLDSLINRLLTDVERPVELTI